jgi:hypothetical protein
VFERSPESVKKFQAAFLVLLGVAALHQVILPAQDYSLLILKQDYWMRLTVPSNRFVFALHGQASYV